MDNLNNIPSVGNWGDAASKLNDNFNKVNIAVETINSKYVRNKGYFPTLAALQAAFPSPKIGDTAYVANVASSSGYYIANVVGGAWVETTTVAPAMAINANEYAKHGYSTTPKTLKQVDDSKAESGGSTKTLKEVDDEIVQLAGDVEQLAYVKIKNEAVNGNFENGLIAPFVAADGGGGASTSAINSSTPISGNYDFRLTITTTSTLSNRPTLYGLHRAGNIGEKIYFHFYAKILSGTPKIAGVNDGITNSTIYGGDVVNGRNTRIIDVEGTGDNLGLIHFDSRSVWDMQMDNFIRINLTETFGAGTEPTKEEMDLLISTLGTDYFEGEITIPAQKIRQWQQHLVNAKASHGYETAEPKTLKQVDDSVSQLADKIDLYSTYKTVENIILNGGFINISYWINLGGTNITSSNGTLSIKILYPIALTDSYLLRNPVTPIFGHKYYYKYSILPKYAGHTRLVFGKLSIDGFTPIPNQWNEKSGIINLDVESSFDHTRIFTIYHNTSVDYEVGDSVQFKNALLIDLTETFGIGNEPTAEWVEQNILLKYADMWFDGVIPVKTVTEIGDDFYKYKSDNDALLSASQNNDVLTSNGDGTAEYKPITSLLPNPDNLEASSGRSATATIAAFNSNIKTKEFADYVCTGVDDQIIINQALNYAEGGKAVLLEGTYNLTAPLLPPNNTEVEIVGKLLVSDSVEDIIVQDAVIGQNYVVVSDGTKFKVGDYVAFYDDNSEVQGGNSTGQTRRHSNAGYVIGVNGNTLMLDGNLVYAITASANPKIGTMFSAILIENKENIYVYGAGTIDGRKASQFDCDPVSMSLGGEDIRVGCCISVKYGTNIRVSGLTMMNGILHNFVSSRSKNTTITHTTCLYAHDKNIIYFFDDNFKAAYNIANYAEFEDGIIGYSYNTNAVIVGNYCEGNNRYGFSFGTKDMDTTSMGNVAIEGKQAAFAFGAKRMTSLGDVSKNGKSTKYDTVISGDYVTLHGFKVVNPADTNIGLFIAGDYCRIYGGHVLMNKHASMLNRGLVFGIMGDITPSNAIIDGLNIESCKTGIVADESVINCRIKNHFLINNTTDVSDLSGGGLIIES